MTRKQNKHKLVINADFGGFSLSQKAVEWLGCHGIYQKYAKLNCIDDIPRHESLLVECVETLGSAANTDVSTLKIIEIESDSYYIVDYDGFERVITPADFVKIRKEVCND